MAKMKKIDYLGKRTIDYGELDKDLKVQISVLGGLDIFTSLHVTGVVNKTKKICDAMGLSYETTKRCVLAAYLHDVGKIMIPPEILQKNGKLTDEEFEIMKKHTVYGYDMCMKYHQFRSLAPIVRAHHENIDGSGYPDGLKENKIPEEAKLIKIADVFDALTQKRQYKEGFKPSKAINIMIEDSINKKKTGALYLYYFVLYTIGEFEDKIEDAKDVIERKKEDFKVLLELEKIYKEIARVGPKKSLTKKLIKYDLKPGYDIIANEKLMETTKKQIEQAENAYEDFKNEHKILKGQARVLKSKIRLIERVHQLS